MFNSRVAYRDHVGMKKSLDLQTDSASIRFYISSRNFFGCSLLLLFGIVLH